MDQGRNMVENNTKTQSYPRQYPQHHHHQFPHHQSKTTRNSLERASIGRSSQRQYHKLTAYERVSKGLPDEKINREITLGKRISHYRLRGELGNGNFSQVKLGIHDLTNGKYDNNIRISTPTALLLILQIYSILLTNSSHIRLCIIISPHS